MYLCRIIFRFSTGVGNSVWIMEKLNILSGLRRSFQKNLSDSLNKLYQGFLDVLLCNLNCSQQGPSLKTYTGSDLPSMSISVIMELFQQDHGNSEELVTSWTTNGLIFSQPLFFSFFSIAFEEVFRKWRYSCSKFCQSSYCNS